MMMNIVIYMLIVAVIAIGLTFGTLWLLRPLWRGITHEEFQRHFPRNDGLL